MFLLLNEVKKDEVVNVYYKKYKKRFWFFGKKIEYNGDLKEQKFVREVGLVCINSDDISYMDKVRGKSYNTIIGYKGSLPIKVTEKIEDLYLKLVDGGNE